MRNHKHIFALCAALSLTTGLMLSSLSQAEDNGVYPDHLQSGYGSIVTDNFNHCVGLGAGQTVSNNQCGPTVAPAAEPTPPIAIPRPQAHEPMVMHHPDITLSADALFDFDKAILKPNGKKAINAELAKIKIHHHAKNPIKAIKIVGYTDNVGSKQYNLKLSLKRAQAVKAYLVKKGLNAKIISVSGLGMADPVATNSTKAGRAKNRRAEIYITYR
ncbi:MAG: OmpA family protein [Betaproteobacteria bacterium]|nr:OmpA family protein [Betaproteobacteria bacterium]